MLRKQEDASSAPFIGGNRHVEHNLTTRHAHEVPILFLSEFGAVVSDKKIFEKVIEEKMKQKSLNRWMNRHPDPTL